MNPLDSTEQQDRMVKALCALFLACALIGLLTIVLPAPEQGSADVALSAILLDRGSEQYPLTIQNGMWLMFFLGLGELWVRSRRANLELDQIAKGILPEDEQTLLQAKDLVAIYRQAKKARYYRLQRLIIRVVQQFQITKSVDQANALMNSSLELMQHEIELKYNMLRYLVWLIPTLGFIGTVVGIAMALSAAGLMPNLDTAEPQEIQAWLSGMTTDLGVAFNTTLLALVMAAILVFLLHIVEGREESSLNGLGQYCLDNLINRLFS